MAIFVKFPKHDTLVSSMKTTLSLNTGVEIPILGYGTWQLKGDECMRSTAKALEIGYRHIDTAAMYDNHAEIAKVLESSNLKRDELFIVSKVWRDSLHHQGVLDACRRALDELRINYLDLYLIHWPDRKIPIAETLEAMQELKDKGLIKACGVSNFTIRHIQDAVDTGIQFSNNQVEFHPTLNQKELKDFCDQHHIVMTAYSPIGRGEDLNHRTIQQLAEKYSRSPSQVILNWILNKDIVAIPKAANPDHIVDNFKTLEWNIAPEDSQLIDEIDQYSRLANPDFSDFDY